MTTSAWFVVVNHSALSTLRRSIPLNRSLYPLKSLLSPDPLNLLVVYLPAFDAQQRRNLPMPVAAILLRQPD